MKTTRKEIYRIYGKDIAICTGYAPFGTKNKNARKVCERWEKLYYNYNFSQRKRMIKRFARELSKTINN